MPSLKIKQSSVNQEQAETPEVKEEKQLTPEQIKTAEEKKAKKERAKRLVEGKERLTLEDFNNDEAAFGEYEEAIEGMSRFVKNETSVLLALHAKEGDFGKYVPVAARKTGTRKTVETETDPLVIAYNAAVTAYREAYDKWAATDAAKALVAAQQTALDALGVKDAKVNWQLYNSGGKGQVGQYKKAQKADQK